MLKKEVIRIASVILSLSLFLVMIGGEAVAVSKICAEDKIAPDLLKLMEQAGKDEKIPVSIWLMDIDQDAVERQTEQTIGFAEADIEVVREHISDDLALRMEKLSREGAVDEDLRQEFEGYMSRNAKSRELEQERADTYISTRRSICREQYTSANDEFLSSIRVSDKDVIFRSQYAPMIIAEMTVKEIYKVAKLVAVIAIRIYVADEPVDDMMSLTQMVDNHGVSLVSDKLGINGNDVNVGMIENGSIDPDINTRDELLKSPRFHIVRVGFGSDPPPYAHATRVARIIAGDDGNGTSGIAPGANVYSYGVYAVNNGYVIETSLEEGIEALLDMDVSVINISYGGGIAPFGSLRTAWLNHVVVVHRLVLVKSAGNAASGFMTEAAVAENVITVSGYYHISPYDNPNNYIMGAPFTFMQGAGNCFKPDLVAPANIDGVSDAGTSFSAPYVTGTVALMLELRPSLKAQPHVVKAILMASVHSKATGFNEQMHQGLTERQGAGVMNPYVSLAITASNNYGVGVITNAGTVNTHDLQKARNQSEGLNVSLVWLRDTTLTSQYGQFCSHCGGNIAHAGERQNLHLEVQNSTIIKNSTLPDTSSQMIYYTDDAWDTDSDFTIRVKKHQGDEITHYAYAWSVNDEKSPVKIRGTQYSVDWTYLDLSWSMLTNSEIKPLKYMTNLEHLKLSGNLITDLSPLSGLVNLEYLTLSGNLISDLSSLSELTNLWHLSVYSSVPTDLTPLSGLTNLRQLSCSNALTDLTPISGLTNLETLDLRSNYNLSDLTPISGLTNLEYLYLSSAQISDLTPLSGLTNLEYLDLAYNQIIDISPLSGLTNLGILWLQNNQVEDLTPLHGLANLGTIALYNNMLNLPQINELKLIFPNSYIVHNAPNYITIRGVRYSTTQEELNLSGLGLTDDEIEPLQYMKRLLYLNLNDNEISDISPLSGLKSLEYLHLNNNQISDLSPLSGLPHLVELSLNNNEISILTPLSGKTSLCWLNLNNNEISDLSPLSGLNFDCLSLANNQISDISVISGMTYLEWLYLDGNQISDISPLSGLPRLGGLTLANNQISDISPLSGLTGLDYLYLNNNQITDVTPLHGMTNLYWLLLQGNPLTLAQVNALRAVLPGCTVLF